MRRIIVPLAGAMFVLSAQFLHADILALYEFNTDGELDTGNNEISLSTDTHSATLASDYSTRSAPIGPAESGVAPTFHAFMSAANTPDNVEPTVNGYFHEFSTTIVNGRWNIDAITFDYWLNAAPQDGSFTVTVFSDLTGLDFASDALGSFTFETDGTSTSTQTVAINFDNVELEGLEAGDTATFRLQFSDNQTVGFVHRIDDLELRGNLAQSVPEPASAFLGLLSLGFLGRRRRSA